MVTRVSIGLAKRGKEKKKEREILNNRKNSLPPKLWVFKGSTVF